MLTKSNINTNKLRRRNKELSILNAIAEALNREVDLDQALRTALAQVADLLDLQTGWIWLLHPNSDESYLAAAQNLPPALVHTPQRMEGNCRCLDTYRAGDLEGAANINVITCSRLYKLVDGTDGLRYHASIPLYAHEKKLGVLNVASTDWRELSTNDLRLLHTVGDLLSIAIERARLFAQSTQLGAAEERNRLAREIHDTLAQALTGIALKLESIDAMLESGTTPKRIQQATQQTLDLTRTTLEETRRSVLDLRAAPLEGRNLPEALADLVDGWQQPQGTVANLEITGGSHPLPVRIEVGLYRIVQEALSNVAQHAQAQKVNITLRISPTETVLIIQDDGQGFESTQIPQGHFGLAGLNERVKLLGGKMKLESSPGQGTRIEVAIQTNA